MTVHRLHLPRDALSSGQIALYESTDPFVLVAGGYGSGKTTGLAVKVLQLVTANPGTPGLIVAPTWPILKAVTLRALNKILVNALGSSGGVKIIDPTGERYIKIGSSTIFVRSAHNPGSIEGLDVGWVVGDEARYWSREAWTVTTGRVRIPCPLPQRALVSTPQMNWLAEEFNSGLPGHALITVPTRENLHNLAPNYLDHLKASYSPRLQRAILEGEFTTLEGAVYEEFDQHHHAMPYTELDVRKHNSKPTYLFVDPGYRKSSVLWCREISPMRWIIFHEWHPNNLSMAAVVDQINAINRDNGIDIDEVWCDPAADNREVAFAVSVSTVLDKIERRSKLYGGVYWITNIYRSITYGVEKVRVLLGDPETGVAPRLYVASHLCGGDPRGIVKGLQGYSYAKQKDNRVVSDIPVKDGTLDHVCDALRYGVVGLWLKTPELASVETDSGMRAASGDGFRRFTAR